MDYPNRTITAAGGDLLGATTGTKNGPVIDKAVLSNKLPNNNTQLADLNLNDIPDAKVYQIQTVKHQGNTSQPEITIHNDDFQDNYYIYTIGLLAHASGSNNEILYIIATADNEPMIMPKKSQTKFDLSIALPFGFSSSSNVTIETTEAGVPSQHEFDSLSSSVSSGINSLSSNAPGKASLSSFASSVSNDLDSLSNNATNQSALSNFSDSVSYWFSSASTVESADFNENADDIGGLSDDVDNNSNYDWKSFSSLSTNVSINSSAISSLANANPANESDVNNLSTNISNVKKSLSNVPDSFVISQMQTDISGNSMAAQEAINSAGDNATSLNSLQGLLNSLETPIDNLSGTVSTDETQISNVSSNANEAQATANHANGTATANKADITQDFNQAESDIKKRPIVVMTSSESEASQASSLNPNIIYIYTE